MNSLLATLLVLAEETSTGDSSSTDSSTEKLKEALLAMVKSPIFYIVVGLIILAIIAIYIIRRFVKASPNMVKVVIRGGKIYKLIDENEPKYFLVPFKDSIGASISLSTKSFSSTKLFINNGPDYLYQFNYTLEYKVVDPKVFYKYVDSIQSTVEARINDDLRTFADNGNTDMLINNYRSSEKDILACINASVNEYGIEATGFKVSYIQPLGK